MNKSILKYFLVKSSSDALLLAISRFEMTKSQPTSELLVIFIETSFLYKFHN
jgi:hypothetical protein